MSKEWTNLITVSDSLPCPHCNQPMLPANYSIMPKTGNEPAHGLKCVNEKCRNWSVWITVSSYYNEVEFAKKCKQNNITQLSLGDANE